MIINLPERKQIRLSEYDYSSDGDYFVTICTKDCQDFFGEIRNGVMGLNEFGCIAAKCWQEIPKYFNCVKLDDWQIMPNHFHCVLNIDIPVGDALLRPDEMRNVVTPNSPNTSIPVVPSRDGDDEMRGVGTSGVQKSGIQSRDANGIQNVGISGVQISATPSRDAGVRPLRGDRSKMVLPKIIHGFKSAVTREINRIQNKIFFQWQRSYYDHIIRNEKSFENICAYIRNNPHKWTLDVENKINRYREIEIKKHYDSIFNKYSE